VPDSTDLDDVRSSYDTVASAYSELMAPALGEKHLVRATLDAFATLVRAGGGETVVDVGCGPGHTTAHLAAADDLSVRGIDLSPRMVEVARASYPDLRFEVGSMTDLDLADRSVAGVVAFYSIIHTPRETLPRVFGELSRVLVPGGHLLVGFHVGSGVRRKTEGYGGHPMSLDVHRLAVGEVVDLARGAGLDLHAELLTERDSPVPQASLFFCKP
jgi:ubiquinone/menaquinone biosynthesis C-methylase UbiE